MNAETRAALEDVNRYCKQRAKEQVDGMRVVNRKYKLAVMEARREAFAEVSARITHTLRKATP